MTDDRPTYLSLFTGIGGLDLAVEALGFRCVGQVEWDESCQRILARHWPDVPRWGDVTEFGAAAYAASGAAQGRDDAGGDRARARARARALGADHRSGPTVDLICGGFPCQPFSTAGRRGGKDDARYLWPEFARIIGELSPAMVLIENVPGLLSLRRPLAGRPGEPVWDYAFGDILRDLSALGFDARWASVRASDTGAPHRRERIFILASHPDRIRRGGATV